MLFGLAGLGLRASVLEPAAAQPAEPGPGRFGPLQPPDDNGIMLPAGFRSRLLAEQGVAVGASGYTWHANPDGGAVFPQADGGWVYTSNEESTPGGAGALRFDGDGEVVDAYRILSGTRHNCAGGPTPWGTWLSCEENLLGQVWECPVGQPGSGSVKPLLGAFSHEAAAVDSNDHRIYLTEDAGGDEIPGRFLWGRFYRFTPLQWRDDGVGVLDLGLLEAMVVEGDPYDGGDGPWGVRWVLADPIGTMVSARLLGATPFDGGEGCWYDGGRVYFTTKGDNRVWALEVATQQLHLLYDAQRLGDDAPLRGVDNATVSPAGDLFVAEDGGNMELVALSDIGGSLQVTPFLRVTGQDGSELAGPAFHPAGDRLYLSSQRGAPGRGRGLTYEIVGPFDAPAPVQPGPSTTTSAAPITVTTAAPTTTAPRSGAAPLGRRRGLGPRRRCHGAARHRFRPRPRLGRRGHRRQPRRPPVRPPQGGNVTRTPIDRRRFLTMGGVVAGAAALGVRPAFGAADDPAALAATPGPFTHGVASGDPLADRVILWTRVTPALPADAVEVRWLVATAPDFTTVVAEGVVTATPATDHTVKVDAAGLTPATTYYYVFEALGGSSPIGRTRTAAPAGTTPAAVRFAVVSCSNYGTGFFNPYARLAERTDLDAVIHVGDYFYEGGGGSVRPVSPPHEIVTLADYRGRHACYRTDPDLQAATAAHPWICTWDDHESANDAWIDGSDNHTPTTEGDWQARKAAAVQAYLEWLPVRQPDPADPLRIWRHLPFGDLADVIVLDTRLYGRNAPETPTGTFDPGSNDRNRSMLGPVQKAWLFEQLTASTTRGAAWRLLAQQTMISPHRNNPAEPPLPYLPEGLVELLGLRQGGGNEGGDNWGAYWRERDEIISFLRHNDVHDNVVVTGDIHSAWGCDIAEDPYNPLAYDRLTGHGSVGVELVCTSVTSNNVQESAPDTAALLNLAVEVLNPNVIYTDVAGHGYTLVELTPAAARGSFWETGDARVVSQTHEHAATLVSHRGTDHLVRDGALVLPRPDRLIEPLVEPLAEPIVDPILEPIVRPLLGDVLGSLGLT